jgi:hypothetical protein
LEPTSLRQRAQAMTRRKGRNHPRLAALAQLF